MVNRRIPIVIAREGASAEVLAATDVPVITASEWESVSRWAGSRGADVVVQPTPRRHRVQGDYAANGVIVSPLDETDEGAEAWAAVLGRPVIRQRDPAELTEIAPGKSLTIALSSTMLTIAWLERIAAASGPGRRSIGIVLATAAAARRHRLLGALSDATGVVAFTQFWDIKEAHLVADATLFGRLSANQFTERMAEQSAALFVQTHGNGADMPIGVQILCAWTHSANQARERYSLGLPCFSGGPCIRGAGPWQEPTRFLNPDKVKSDFVMLDTCNGIMPEDGVLATSTTIAPILMTGGWVRSFLAPIRIQRTDVARFTDAVVRYLAGASLGELTQELNRNGADLYGEPPCWILFGDPDMAAPSRLPAPTISRSTRGWEVRPDDHSLAFACRLGTADGPTSRYRTVGPVERGWKACVGSGLSAAEPGSLLTVVGVQRVAEDAFLVTDESSDVLRGVRHGQAWIRDRMIRRVQQALVMRRWETILGLETGGLADQLHEAAIRLATMEFEVDRAVDKVTTTYRLAAEVCRGSELDRRLSELMAEAVGRQADSMQKAWSGIMQRNWSDAASSCPWCTSPQRRERLDFVLADGASRDIFTCERCGPTADMPKDVRPPRLQIVNHAGRDALELPALDCAVGPVWVSIGNATPDVRGQRAPIEVSGSDRALRRWEQSVQLPLDHACTGDWLVVVIVWDGQLAIVRARQKQMT